MPKYYRMENYYDILEIEESASPKTIKQAYRQLIQVWHPDRFQSNRELRLRAENKTKQITEAFRNLTDPNLRRQHDLDLNRKRHPSHLNLITTSPAIKLGHP